MHNVVRCEGFDFSVQDRQHANEAYVSFQTQALVTIDKNCCFE